MKRKLGNNYPKSFAFRLTQADGERLKAVATAAGTSPGEWAREVVSTALGLAYKKRSMRRHVANADALRRLLGELGRQGSNLNQAAARLNSEPSIDAAAARRALEAIRAGQTAIVASILGVLGGTDKP